MPGLAVELFVTHAPAFASRRAGSFKPFGQSLR